MAGLLQNKNSLDSDVKCDNTLVRRSSSRRRKRKTRQDDEEQGKSNHFQDQYNEDEESAIPATVLPVVARHSVTEKSDEEGFCEACKGRHRPHTCGKKLWRGRHHKKHVKALDGKSGAIINPLSTGLYLNKAGNQELIQEEITTTGCDEYACFEQMFSADDEPKKEVEEEPIFHFYICDNEDIFSNDFPWSDRGEG
eukprot:CAMPEP_0172641814 /NCGR_PEP_ID=MMETSP1068-20121228/229200_1 /TAXON_ID=35684 /ORGANISM="Pseudopedinella elastica, Strain CCMP716" /LENGTH=195 /DNA_ID=CAMNT_0013455493 /DNA_START=314 /DNA_END=901 /DNA_ORIENTATION=-